MSLRTLALALIVTGCGADAVLSGGPCGPGGACPGGQTCHAPTQLCLREGECPPDQTLCGSACLPLDTDPTHCGSCGNACGGATPYCASGSCVAQCPAGMAQCGFGCIDLHRDRYNCGECGEICQGATVCIDEDCESSPCGPCPPDAPLCEDDRCVESCGTGRVQCGTVCADLSADVEHCGSCSESCPDDALCVSGHCECPFGTQECRDECADLSASDRNCGFCGNDCGSFGKCTDGKCACLGTLVDCDAGAEADCVDPSADPRNCGGCGTRCGDREACIGGSCMCRPGLSDCDSGPDLQCRDLASDPNHCGGCGEGCGDMCREESCVADCGNLDECDNACVDREVHPLHCGDCDTVCHGSQVCSEGECRRFRPALLCDACPCEACSGEFERCCSYPGTANVICVDGPCPVAL